MKTIMIGGLTIVLMTGILAGCDKPKPVSTAQLTCEEAHAGRTKEERQEMADACFRRGKFVKSTPREW